MATNDTVSQSPARRGHDLVTLVAQTFTDIRRAGLIMDQSDNHQCSPKLSANKHCKNYNFMLQITKFFIWLINYTEKRQLSAASVAISSYQDP